MFAQGERYEGGGSKISRTREAENQALCVHKVCEPVQTAKCYGSHSQSFYATMGWMLDGWDGIIEMRLHPSLPASHCV